MEDRIYVAWPGGYFITSAVGEEFQKQFLEMVAEMGRPSVVEFRAADEGWYEDDYEKQTREDYEASEGEEHESGNHHYSAIDY